MGLNTPPDPKPARAPTKRYRRKVASRKQWAAIAAEKTGPCRVCGSLENGRVESRIQLHHVVARNHGGHDRPANIVPLCIGCHEDVTLRFQPACRSMLEALTDDEYAEMVAVGGETYAERAYSVRYTR